MSKQLPGFSSSQSRQASTSSASSSYPQLDGQEISYLLILGSLIPEKTPFRMFAPRITDDDVWRLCLKNLVKAALPIYESSNQNVIFLEITDHKLNRKIPFAEFCCCIWDDKAGQPQVKEHEDIYNIFHKSNKLVKDCASSVFIHHAMFVFRAKIKDSTEVIYVSFDIYKDFIVQLFTNFKLDEQKAVEGFREILSSLSIDNKGAAPSPLLTPPEFTEPVFHDVPRDLSIAIVRDMKIDGLLADFEEKEEKIQAWLQFEEQTEYLNQLLIQVQMGFKILLGLLAGATLPEKDVQELLTLWKYIRRKDIDDDIDDHFKKLEQKAKPEAGKYSGITESTESTSSPDLQNPASKSPDDVKADSRIGTEAKSAPVFSFSKGKSLQSMEMQDVKENREEYLRTFAEEKKRVLMLKEKFTLDNHELEYLDNLLFQMGLATGLLNQSDALTHNQCVKIIALWNCAKGRQARLYFKQKIEALNFYREHLNSTSFKVTGMIALLQDQKSGQQQREIKYEAPVEYKAYVKDNLARMLKRVELPNPGIALFSLDIIDMIKGFLDSAVTAILAARLTIVSVRLMYNSSIAYQHLAEVSSLRKSVGDDAKEQQVFYGCRNEQELMSILRSGFAMYDYEGADRSIGMRLHLYPKEGMERAIRQSEKEHKTGLLTLIAANLLLGKVYEVKQEKKGEPVWLPGAERIPRIKPTVKFFDTSESSVHSPNYGLKNSKGEFEIITAGTSANRGYDTCIGIYSFLVRRNDKIKPEVCPNKKLASALPLLNLSTD